MSVTTEAIICIPKRGAKPWPKKGLSKQEAYKLKPRQQCLVFPYNPRTQTYTAPTKVTEPKPIVREGRDNKYHVDNNIPNIPHWIRMGTRANFFNNPLSSDPTNKVNLFYEITPSADVRSTIEEAKQVGGITRISSKNIMGIEIFDAKTTTNPDNNPSTPINKIEQEAMSMVNNLLYGATGKEGTSGVKEEWKNAISLYLTQLSSNTLPANSEPPLLK